MSSDKFDNFFDLLGAKAPQAEVNEILEYFQKVSKGIALSFVGDIRKKTVYWYDLLCLKFTADECKALAFSEEGAAKHRARTRSGWGTFTCNTFCYNLERTLKQSYILYAASKK